MQSQPKINSLSMQSNPKVIEKGEKSQSPICENNEQQSRSLSSQVNLESFSQANTNTQWKMSEHSMVTSTVMPQYMANHHPVVLDAANPGNWKLQSNLLLGNNAIPNVSNSTVIGQDIWQQLKRVSIPTFMGDKKKFQHCKAAFLACVDQAPTTARYKLLQLKQCFAG